ncbi:MAG: nucleotidyltransferase domain-containing protein [Bacilli bacterium]|nr:nucleotidyltransferase domain-containing protein [Bacilli bacterium]
MINIRNIEYEYKTISSFFDNKIKFHFYDEIKSIIIGKEISKEFKYTNSIRKMHRFLILSFSNYNNTDFELLYKDFNYVCETAIENKKITKLREIFEAGCYKKNKAVILLLECINEENMYIAFFEFVLFQIFLYKYYKDYVVIPMFLFDYFFKIKDIEVKSTFLYGIIERGLKKHQTNLKSEIIKIYMEQSEELKKIGIQNIWLFGSVQKEEYNDLSDIDLVIKVDNEESEGHCIEKIRNFNKKWFDRKSDIHIYDDFIEYNPNITIEKLI